MFPQAEALTVIFESANLEGYKAGKAEGLVEGILMVLGVAAVVGLLVLVTRPESHESAQPLQPVQPALPATPMVAATAPIRVPVAAKPAKYSMA